MKKNKTYIRLEPFSPLEETHQGVKGGNFIISKSESKYHFFNHPGRIIAGSLIISTSCALSIYCLSAQILGQSTINSFISLSIGLGPIQALLVLASLATILATLSVLIELNYGAGPERPIIKNL